MDNSELQSLVANILSKNPAEGGEILRGLALQEKLAVVESLGLQGDTSAFEPLLDLLWSVSQNPHSHPSLRTSIEEALILLGQHDSTPLVQALLRPRFAFRYIVVQILSKLSWQPADAIQRAALAVAKGDLNASLMQPSSAAVPALIATLRCTPWSPYKPSLPSWPEPSVNDVLDAIASYGEESVEHLLAAFRSETVYTDATANIIDALGQTRSSRAAEFLVELGMSGMLLSLTEREVARERMGVCLQQNFETAGFGALGAIRALGELAVEPLIRKIQERAEPRYIPITSLGEIASERAVPVLRELLTDSASSVRKHAAESLESVGWRPENTNDQILLRIALLQMDEVIALGGSNALLEILGNKSENEGVRAAAAKALSHSRDKRAVGPCINSLPAVWAGEALGRIAHSEAILPLLEMANRHLPLQKVYVDTTPLPDNEPLAERMHQWLRSILEFDATNASVETLKAVARMKSLRQQAGVSILHWDVWHWKRTGDHLVDCSDLRKMAIEELERRSIPFTSQETSEVIPAARDRDSNTGTDCTSKEGIEALRRAL